MEVIQGYLSQIIYTKTNFYLLVIIIFVKGHILTSDLKARIVDDPSSVSVKDVYIGERETLSSLLNSLDVDL